MMEPLQIILEWQRGCTITNFEIPDGKPQDCRPCTEAMLAALRNYFRNHNPNGVEL